MNRRNFIRNIGGTALASTALPKLGAAPAVGRSKTSQRPNIIYLVVHDLGRHLSSYGAPIETPHLAALAEESLQLNQAYCGSPPCSPSRGCVMTGKYSHSNGLMGMTNFGWSLPVETRTIVDELNADGYETVHTGFQHERAFIKDNRYAKELSQGHNTIEGRLIENVVDSALEYLKARKPDDKPFYLNMGSQEAHASMWMNGARYERELKRPDTLYGIVDPKEAYVPPHLPDIEYSRETMGRFQACIRYMDSQIGRFIDGVRKLGLMDNTMFVFTTDHGITGSRAKGTLYDRGMEIATYVRMPNPIMAGKQDDSLINNIDFLPTMLEYTGTDIPEGIQGRSFLPLLNGERYTRRKKLYTERNYHANYDPMRSVRSDRYHYIHNFGITPRRYYLPSEIEAMHESGKRADRWVNQKLYSRPTTAPELSKWPIRPAEELYDTHNDPEEFINLFDNPKYSDVLSELRTDCDNWMSTTNDPLLNGPIPDKLNGWPEKNS